MHRDIDLLEHCFYVSTHCNREQTETYQNTNAVAQQIRTGQQHIIQRSSTEPTRSIANMPDKIGVYQVYVDFARDGEEDTTVANSEWTLHPPVTDCLHNLWQGLLLLFRHKEH